MNLSDVIKGYVNANKDKRGTLNKSKSALAAHRLSICMGCEILSDDKTTCDKNKGGCNCPVNKKVYCISCSCPKAKW